MNEVQLTPVGVFPHSRGFQQIDAPALAALVKNFNSFFARLGRRFAGIPFYIGHPDVPGYENIYPDRKAYGWIMELEAREDGLYARPKWSKAGQELIENGHYKFLSPYWEAANIGSKDGKPLLRPTVLISVGLTNQPNIPVLPLANNTELESVPLVGMSLPLSIDSALDNSVRQLEIRNQEFEIKNAQIPDPKSFSSPTLESPNRESQIVNSKSADRLSQPETRNLTSLREALVSSGETLLRRAWEANPETTEGVQNSRSQIPDSELDAGSADVPPAVSGVPPETSPSTPSRPSVKNPRSQIPDPKSFSSPTLECPLPNSDVDSRLSSLESTIQQLETRNQELETATRELSPCLESPNRESQIVNRESSPRLESPNRESEIVNRELSPRLESPNRELEIANRKLEVRLPQLETELQARLSTLEISNRELEIANRKLEVRLINTLLNHALADLRLLPAERDYWLHQLESNFDAASLALANAQPKLNRHSRTDNLPIINTPTPNGKTRTDQILTLVNERMRVTGQPFHQSWIETKKHHPTLFQ